MYTRASYYGDTNYYYCYSIILGACVWRVAKHLAGSLTYINFVKSEKLINCNYFPTSEFFTKDPVGGVISVFGSVLMCSALVVVCDHFFARTLEVLLENLVYSVWWRGRFHLRMRISHETAVFNRITPNM